MQIFSQLKQELEIHTRLEEEVFYPALKLHHPKDISHAEQEHETVTKMLQDLDEASKVLRLNRVFIREIGLANVVAQA